MLPFMQTSSMKPISKCSPCDVHPRIHTREIFKARNQMNNTSPSQAEFEANTEFQDVVILGAGITGIGSAHYLKSRLPEKSFVILDQMDTIGGTWAIHKYP